MTILVSNYVGPYGSAAKANIGTSGDAVPKLNGVGVWSDTQQYNGQMKYRAIASTPTSISVTSAPVHTITVSEATSIGFTNLPANDGTAYGFTLVVNHTSGTIAWPASVKWKDLTAPTLTAGKRHLFAFITTDGGSNWFASSVINT